MLNSVRKKKSFINVSNIL